MESKKTKLFTSEWVLNAWLRGYLEELHIWKENSTNRPPDATMYLGEYNDNAIIFSLDPEPLAQEAVDLINNYMKDNNIPLSKL